MDDCSPADNSGSYCQIVKSTAILGVSSIFNVGIRIVRTKLLAMLLGPAGIGLIGMYNSVVEMSGTITGLGVDSSGVKQIAEATSAGNDMKLARTTHVVRIMNLILGVLGMLLLIM